ncbi:MAG: hypothetical protein AMXMBFR56_20340 [Polyangiaceae bacterium]
MSFPRKAANRRSTSGGVAPLRARFGLGMTLAAVVGCGDAGSPTPALGDHRHELTSGKGFQSSSTKFTGPHSYAQLGVSLAGLGDVNGDGFEDLAVGAPFYDPFNQALNYGRFYLYFGSAAGLSATKAQIVDGDQQDQYRGNVVRAGDVNGDGYADAFVQGELNTSTLSPPKGEKGVELLLGGPSGLTLSSWKIPLYPTMPRALGGVGDVNGDGRGDVLIHTREFVTSWTQYFSVYAGTATGLSATPLWVYSDTTSITGAGVGDVTGDGFNDLVIGAASCGSPNLKGFWGSAAGFPSSPSWIYSDPDCGPFVGVGAEIERLGDIDGDGYADWAASSNWYAKFDFNGLLKVFRGGATPSTTPAWAKQFPDNVSGQLDVAGVGDAYGDGYADLLVGLSYFFNPHNGSWDPMPPLGRARVYFGSASGLGATESWWAYDESLNANMFASRAVGAGDLTGDGFPEIAIGDRFAELDETKKSQGFAYVYYGAGGPEPVGKVLWNLTAHEPGATKPLAAGERLENPSSFDVRAVGLGTEGRSRIALEVEVKPDAAAFDGTNLAKSAAWSDSGIAGTPLECKLTGLKSNTTYKFRARVVHRPDTAVIARHSRWFSGITLVTDCSAADPDIDGDGECDDKDADDDDDSYLDAADCLPKDPSAHPGATEVLDDGIDQDCSGKDSVTCLSDVDGDGFGSAVPAVGHGGCSAPGVTAVPGDCDDAVAQVHPGAADGPGDGVDQDCDGEDTTDCYTDADGDGFGVKGKIVPASACAGAGQSKVGGDCSDGDENIFPGAVEIPGDGVDQDCTGFDGIVCYFDADADGFGATEAGAFDGDCPFVGMSSSAGDCNDDDPQIFPGSTELAGDGIDQDCDGEDAPGQGDAAPEAGAPFVDGGSDAGDMPGRPEGAGGCGCDLAQTRSPGWKFLVLALALLIARRRSRRSSTRQDGRPRYRPPALALALPFVGALSLQLLGCTPRPSAGEAAPKVELTRAGKTQSLDAAATRALIVRVEKALAVCNFRSDQHANVFGAADPTAVWKEREGRAHLRLSYATDKSVEAVAGRLVFREVLLSVDEPNGPEPALVRGDATGILGLKKCGYDDRLLGCAPELAAHFPRPAACPPGY